MYLFAAGGTGGHIIPAMAVARALEPDEHSIVFVGAGSPLEEKLIAKSYPLESIAFTPVLGKGLRGLFQMLMRLPAALREGRALLRKHQIQSVIAFGGYPSFIPFLAAWTLGVPRILVEQNAKVGLANRALAFISSKIFAVRGAQGFLFRKVDTYIQNPIRQEFAQISDFTPVHAETPLVVLVLGGSQGAVAINDAVLKVAKNLEAQHIEIHHVAGERNYDQVCRAYKALGLDDVNVYGFISQLWNKLEHSHLVISRAGAMSAAELQAARRPVLYIPLKIAAAHQSENIQEQVAAGAALELEQDDSLAERLEEIILRFRKRPEELEAMAAHMQRLHEASSKDWAGFLASEMRKLAKSRQE